MFTIHGDVADDGDMKKTRKSMTMIVFELLGSNPYPTMCSLCLQFPEGPRTNTFTRYLIVKLMMRNCSSILLGYIKDTLRNSERYIWGMLYKILGQVSHKRNYSIVETACNHGWGEWVRLLCEVPTIIIHNYCSNYFNIITAPIYPRKWLWGSGSIHILKLCSTTKFTTTVLYWLCV